MDGVDWRTWTAADHAAVAYLWLQRQYAGDRDELRKLFELVEDKDAVAGLDREIMGQSRQIPTDR